MKKRGSKERITIAIIALAVILIYLINQPSAEAGMKSGTTSTTSLIPVQSPPTGAAAAGQSQATGQSATEYDQKYLEEKWEPKVDAMILGSDKTNPSEVIEDAKKFQDKDLARRARTKISELAAKSPSITMPGALQAINNFLDGLNSAAKNSGFNKAMANAFKGKIGPGSDFSTPSALSLKGSTITNGKVSIPLEKLSNSKVVALPDGGFMVDGVKLSESAEHLQTSESKGKRAIDAKIEGVSLKINDIDPEAGIEVDKSANGYKVTAKKPANIETPSFKGMIGSEKTAGGATIEASKSGNAFETRIIGQWRSNTKQFIPDQDVPMSGQEKTTFRYENNQLPEATSIEGGITIGAQTFTGKTPDGKISEAKIKFGQVHHDQLGDNEAWWFEPTKYMAKGFLEVKAVDTNGNQVLKHQGADANTVIGLNRIAGRDQIIDYLAVYNTDKKKTGLLALVSFQDDENNVKFSRDSEGLKITPSSKTGPSKTPFGNPIELIHQGDDSTKYSYAYIKDGRFSPGMMPESAGKPPQSAPSMSTLGPAAAAEPEPEAPPAAREGAGTTRREEAPSSDEEDGEETAPAAASTGETKEKPKLPSIPVTDEMRNSKNGAARIYAKLLDYASKIEDPERRAEVLAKIQNGMNKVTAAYGSAPPEIKSSGLAALQPVATVMAGAISAAAGFAAGSAITAAPSTPTPAPSIAPIAAAPTVSPGAGTAGGQQATNPIASSTIPPPSAAQSPSPANPLPEPVRAAQIQGLVEVPFESATKFVKYNQLQEGDVIVRGFDTKGYIDAFRYDPPSRSYRALTNPIQFPGGAISEQQMSQWLTEYTGWRVGAPKRTIS